MREIYTLFNSNIDVSIFEPYTINCDNCCGLCCVALYFSKTEGFPENKNAGIPCKNLQSNYNCQIHLSLSNQGLKGCMAYDCFGAGQQVTNYLSSYPNWKTISQSESKIIFDSYLIIMQIHQILWYLTVASILHLEKTHQKQINALLSEGRSLTKQPLELLQNLDIDLFREKSNKLLKAICLKITSDLSSHKLSSQEKLDLVKNYMGKNLKHKNLVGKDFSMSLLIATNLEGANLFGANFLGADMRDTNLKNTDLSQCLFLTQIQINAAKGNTNTILPPYLYVPLSWKE